MIRETAGSKSDMNEFVHLLTINQRKIYSYILKLVANFNDADDIMQDTTAIMWKKYDTFIPGTNFLGWAVRIAHYNILSYRTKKGKERLIIDDELFESIQIKAVKSNDTLDSKLKYLKECLSKLRFNSNKVG